MITFYLNANNDLEFDGQNNIKTVDGKEEKEQFLSRLLTTNRREFFLDADFGMDILSILSQQPTNELVVRATILEALARARITDITDVEVDGFDRETRRLKIRLVVDVEGEEIEFEQEVG